MRTFQLPMDLSKCVYKKRESLEDEAPDQRERERGLIGMTLQVSIYAHDTSFRQKEQFWARIGPLDKKNHFGLG